MNVHILASKQTNKQAKTHTHAHNQKQRKEDRRIQSIIPYTPTLVTSFLFLFRE